MGPELDDRDLEEYKRSENRLKMNKKSLYKKNKMLFANGDIYTYDDTD